MAFVDIPTLDGGHVHVAVDSVYRITHSAPGGGSTGATRVDFGGETQFTLRSVADVARMVTEAGAKLIEFTAPDGAPAYLALAAITAVRAADPSAEPAAAHAVVTVAVLRQAVRQTQAEVERALSAAA